MSKIHAWSVARSGPSLTVTGRDEAGAPVKLTKVARVDRVGDGAVAIRGDERHELA